MEIKIPSSFKNTKRSPLVKWLLEGHVADPDGYFEDESSAEHKHKTHPWWQVMCLTGVDYFSTLGYQPSIAIGAVGGLSPFATIVLVLVTLFGAYPVYARVAVASPHGEGSISMLQKLVASWQGKLLVLVLLGFAATDFVITMTLSAADAAEHIIGNSFFEKLVHNHTEPWLVPFTLLLLAALGAVFLKGFKEAVGLAVLLVVLYLGLNAVVLGKGLLILFQEPVHFHNWKSALFDSPKSPNLGAIAIMIIVGFPKLALGLSGFETGAAVMTLVKGDKKDSEEHPVGRIRNTKKLLLAAALIMSVLLIASSFVTTLLIDQKLVTEAGGKANGRALAYLAQEFFGTGFGTVYDVSTILILWFAGASAMAGLLNLVPRYLPKYGMAPEWTKANRPLVLLFLTIAVSVTLLFKINVDSHVSHWKEVVETVGMPKAEELVKAGKEVKPHTFVEAQAGAYATGVLVLMTSAAFAVFVTVKKRRKLTRFAFATITIVFLYTLIANVLARSDGLKIAAFFIIATILVSFISRIWRTLELRVNSVELDLKALDLVREATANGKPIRIIPNRPESRDREEYERKEYETRRDHDIESDEAILFVEVTIKDASNFTGNVKVRGYEVDGYKVLRATGVAVPNSLAALLLHLGQLTGNRAHAYFNWGERGPGAYLMKFLFSGEGDIAPLTREILRRVETDPNLRPVIHAAS
jgi:hypothetical protein